MVVRPGTKASAPPPKGDRRGKLMADPQVLQHSTARNMPTIGSNFQPKVIIDQITEAQRLSRQSFDSVESEVSRKPTRDNPKLIAVLCYRTCGFGQATNFRFWRKAAANCSKRYPDL